jgi:antitoxin component YwqK of YwqJK toxin-antitoxin module
MTSLLNQSFPFLGTNLSLLLTLLSFCFVSCSKSINQYQNKEKHGRWIESDRVARTYSKGRYFKGQQVGTWRDYSEDGLYRKERFRANASKLKFYYPNGKISSSGQTLTEEGNTGLHWFYTGKWKFFDDKGRLIEERTYHKGKAIEINTK